MTTKVFVSSVSRGLEEIRHQIGTYLTTMGHEPILFESDFFSKTRPYSMVDICLKEVERCHIYILIVGKEVGFKVEEVQKSITHLELRKALATNKTILVFVKNYIKDVYFHEFQRVFRELKSSDYYIKEGRIPYFHEVYKKMGNHSLPKEVLEIVHDAYQEVPWLFSFETADDIKTTLRMEFSSLLESYIELRNKKQIRSIDDILLASERFRQIDLFLNDIRPFIKEVRTYTELSQILKKVQANLKGGIVYYDEGAHILTEMVAVGNCDGTSVYRFDGKNTLHLIAQTGLAGGQEQSPLDDHDSFVSTAYREALSGQLSPLDHEDQPYLTSSMLFSTNKVIYMCHVFAPYVFTTHFPIESLFVSWEVIRLRTNELYTGIMNIRANNDVISYLSLFLRGREDGNE
ncbi:DUF4062 domain-containing protein [Brevibacillus dissolubilis]|uniref:DUF4062 domain-containing protein n=1 Tax=Brevibacillus dissolubilis TaxID=1844116 RepID=UPI0011171026|nr:DUF4062 domain-containing protein [Brevibacillus dissolubilis]